MGAVPHAKLFYGISLDRDRFPEEVKALKQLVNCENAVATYLLETLGHEFDQDDLYESCGLLEKKTGVSVIDLGSGQTFLALHRTITVATDSGKPVRADVGLADMGEVLALERYARMVGQHDTSGDWFLWRTFK